MKMKKSLFAILTCLALVLTMLCACGSEPKEPNIPEDDNNQSDNQTPTVEITDTLELLNTVWNVYPEENKFAIAGGDGIMDAPGKYTVEGNGETLDNMTAFPKDCESLIDDAASLFHMMNANTFTAGAFRLKNADDAADLMQKLRDNIASRQWMCGFPDKFMVASIGNYVVSAYGNEEIMDSFKSSLIAAYPDTAVSFEEAIQ